MISEDGVPKKYKMLPGADQIKRKWPAFVENWYRQPVFKGIVESPYFSQMVERKKLNDPEKLALVLDRMGQGAQPSLWNNLKDLKKLVRLLAGDQDSKYLILTEKMKKEIPQSTRRVIAECSHNIHLQNPGQFNLEVMKFFSSD